MHLTGKIAQGDWQDLGKQGFSAGQRKIPRLWILTADRHIAKIFRKSDDRFECLGTALPADTHQDLSNDSVGRVVASAGRHVHHKYEPHMNAAHERALAFHRALAKWLDGAARQNIFDRLVLVAEPQTMGDLRLALGREAQNRIIAEVSKDLTRHDEASLKRELEQIVWF